MKKSLDEIWQDVSLENMNLEEFRNSIYEWVKGKIPRKKTMPDSPEIELAHQIVGWNKYRTDLLKSLEER